MFGVAADFVPSDFGSLAVFSSSSVVPLSSIFFSSSFLLRLFHLHLLLLLLFLFPLLLFLLVLLRLLLLYSFFFLSPIFAWYPGRGTTSSLRPRALVLRGRLVFFLVLKEGKWVQTFSAARRTGVIYEARTCLRGKIAFSRSPLRLFFLASLRFFLSSFFFSPISTSLHLPSEFFLFRGHGDMFQWVPES